MSSAASEAAHAAVTFLDQEMPLDLWLLSRVDDVRMTVLVCDGVWSDRFPVGTVLPWLESFCLHMVAGTVPPMTTRVADVQPYADAATGRWADVRGYTGVPLLSGDGELYGTLAGYTGLEDDPQLAAAAAPLRLIGGLLSSILTTDTEAAASVAGLSAELSLAREGTVTDARVAARG